MRIPPGINQKVIDDWFNGLSRDEIAKRHGLSPGTISNIIKQTTAETGEHDIDTIRALAKLLKKEDIGFDGIIQCVRIKKRIQAMGLDIAHVEKYIELLDEHCFRKQIEPEKFIESIDFVVNLPNDEQNVQTLEQKLRSLGEKIKSKEEKLNRATDEVKEITKSIMEKRKEEKKLLLHSKAYKEINEAVAFGKLTGIHPYFSLSSSVIEFEKNKIRDIKNN